MPQITDIEAFCAVDMPENDTDPSGGAIDASGTSGAPGVQPFPTHITGAPTKARFVSDGADTGSIDVRGRLPSGAIATEVVVLTGTTPVDSANTYERLLKAARQVVSTTRTTTVKRADTSAVLGVIPPNRKALRTLFPSAASAASSQVRQEKIFVRNGAADAALDATVKLSADPSAIIRIGVAASKGDSAHASPNNRTGTFGVSLFDDNVVINVPTGILGAAENIGVIVEQTLAGGGAQAPVKDTFTVDVDYTSIS